MSETVWAYWSGPMWPHIQICLNSMARWNKRLHVVRDEEIDDLVPKGLLNERWKEIPQSGPRACCLRAALLYVHGGFWADADTVALQAFDWDESAELVYSTWNRFPTRVLTGYIGASKGSAVIKRWIDGINWTLENEWDPLREWWLVLGEKILTPAVTQSASKSLVKVPLETFIPLDMDQIPQYYCEPIDWHIYLKPCTQAFALNHSWLVGHHKWGLLLPPSSMAASPLLIHQLLTHARLPYAAD